MTKCPTVIHVPADLGTRKAPSLHSVGFHGDTADLKCWLPAVEERNLLLVLLARENQVALRILVLDFFE